MVSKSSRSVPPHILSLLRPNQECFCAQMLPREVSISQMLTGLCSSIHQMIQKIIFIESGVQQEELEEKEERCCLSMSMKLDS